MCFCLKLDIKNPLLLFLVIFILYQISYPILNLLNIRVFEYSLINDNYYLYNWIATVSFIIFYGKIENIRYDVSNLSFEMKSNIMIVIYVIMSLICIFSSFYIIYNGFQSKYELANSGNKIIQIGNIFYTILIIYPVYLNLGKNISNKNKNILSIFNLLLMIFGMLTFGERSYLFNYIIVYLLFYFTCNKINYKQVLIIFTLAFILLSTSSSMKMFLSSNKYRTVKNDNIVVGFLNSDFASAGFNFNYLLNNENDTKGIFLGKTYIYDFLSPFEDLLPISKYSSTKWYSNKYWSTRKTGLGFSIIGEGYINFGLIGIIVEMFILARLTKFLYKRSNKNSYYYIIYLGYLSLMMYSCRQALGNIISPLFKYHILLALLIFFINKVEMKKERVLDE